MRTLMTVVVTAVVALAGSGVQAQPRPVTIDDVLDLKAVGSPMVSPDGSRVLFTVRGWEDAPGGTDRRESRTHVWLATADGASSRQVTFGARGESMPQWSPDGRFISFVAARGAAAGDEPPRRRFT
ncbi:MAG: hypothetical protein R2712_19745 [Vicinamibacterales bacterium]